MEHPIGLTSKMGLSGDKWAESEKKKKKHFWPGWDNRVFLRWKGSLWKHVWDELLIYTMLYFAISLIYRFAFTHKQQEIFHLLIIYCKELYAGLPLMFILGFYVSMVVTRWWALYNSLPWPDEVALYLRETISGAPEEEKHEEKEEERRMVRRTIMRYCILSYILALRRHSMRLRRRYQTTASLIKTGLVTAEEMDLIDEDDLSEMYTSNWWVPLQWCTEIIADAKTKELVAADWVPLGQIVSFKKKLQDVKTYGNVPVPLVYSQVVTLAVYIYFGCTLIADQWVVGAPLDLWYPIFGTMKFLFFWGWLSTARALYNPLGDDDEDFQLNKLIDRHLKVSMEIVDSKKQTPKLDKDPWWDMPEAKLRHLDDLDRAASQFDSDNFYMSKLQRNDPGKQDVHTLIEKSESNKTSRSSSYQRLNTRDPEA